jgi:hypothetical protein
VCRLKPLDLLQVAHAMRRFVLQRMYHSPGNGLQCTRCTVLAPNMPSHSAIPLATVCKAHAAWLLHPTCRVNTSDTPRRSSNRSRATQVRHGSCSNILGLFTRRYLRILCAHKCIRCDHKLCENGLQLCVMLRSMISLGGFAIDQKVCYMSAQHSLAVWVTTFINISQMLSRPCSGVAFERKAMVCICQACDHYSATE